MAKIIKKMNLFTLTMVSLAFVVSIRNQPMMAETGLKMLFFALVAAVGYAIPASLVSAELATGWPDRGGVYVWIREAFGKKMGFVGIIYQWAYMLISVIAMLYFVGGSLAYVFAPKLADNRMFLVIILLLVTWGCTYFNLRGLGVSALISKIGFLGGVLLPALIIIGLGIAYIFMGKAVQIDLSFTRENLFPDFSNFANLVLLVGFMRAFAGIEASAVHANSVDNPRRDYPLAILSVIVVGLILFIFGSLAVAVVIPQKDINLVSGIMEAFTTFFQKFNMVWPVPILGLLAAMGQIGGLTTWFMGPIKGVYSSALDGSLPRFCQKENSRQAPKNLLIIQAIIVSVLGIGILSFPSINVAFFFSVALSMMIYVVMYMLMFVAAIYLRYKAKDVYRKYRIPGPKNIGMWITCIVGFLTMVFSFIIAFFPPAQIPTGNRKVYVIGLSILIFIILVIPFIINAFQKTTWKAKTKKKVKL